MMSVLRQNRKAQTKLQERLENLKEEQQEKYANINRVSMEVRHELVRMKAIGEMYRDYSLANLTTKQKLRRPNFISRDEKNVIPEDQIVIGLRGGDSKALDIPQSESVVIPENGGLDAEKKENVPESAPNPVTEQISQTENNAETEENATESASEDVEKKVVVKSEVESYVVPISGPFGLYRGPQHRSSQYGLNPTKSFIRSTGGFSLNRESTNENAEAPKARRLSVVVQKVGNSNQQRLKPIANSLPIPNTTHIMNFYGFHTVTQNNESTGDNSKNKSLDPTRETTAMFAKRRAALLPPNITTAYAFRKFMDQKKADVLKESTPEKVRQKKLQKLVPHVKFPEIIQRNRTFSAIIRDHEQYKENRGPSPDRKNPGGPSLNRRCGSTPQLRTVNKNTDFTNRMLDIPNFERNPARNDRKTMKHQLPDEKELSATENDNDETPPHLKTDDDPEKSVLNNFEVLVTENFRSNGLNMSVRPRLERVEETM